MPPKVYLSEAQKFQDVRGKSQGLKTSRPVTPKINLGHGPQKVQKVVKAAQPKNVGQKVRTQPVQKAPKVILEVPVYNLRPQSAPKINNLNTVKPPKKSAFEAVNHIQVKAPKQAKQPKQPKQNIVTQQQQQYQQPAQQQQYQTQAPPVQYTQQAQQQAPRQAVVHDDRIPRTQATKPVSSVAVPIYSKAHVAIETASAIARNPNHPHNAEVMELLKAREKGWVDDAKFVGVLQTLLY